jgi:hypothetical protein
MTPFRQYDFIDKLKANQVETENAEVDMEHGRGGCRTAVQHGGQKGVFGVVGGGYSTGFRLVD